MAWSSCFIYLVFTVLFAVSKADGDCTEAGQDLYSCVMEHNIDYNQVDDPAYRPVMCREIFRMRDCVQDAFEECPALNAQYSSVLAGLDTQISTYCPNTGNACENPMDVLNECQNILTNADPQNMCSAADEYISCLEDVPERCPQLQSAREQIEMSIDMIRDAKTSMQCGQSAEPSSPPECTRIQTKFEEKFEQCQEPIMFNVRHRHMCRELRKVVSCAEELMESCQDRDWMTEDYVQAKQHDINMLREAQSGFECEDD